MTNEPPEVPQRDSPAAQAVVEMPRPTIAPLVLSGYAVQVFTGGSLRKGMGWTHAALGAVYILAYAAHLLKKRPVDEVSPA